ncbi:MAG: VOC family protein [Rhodospirillaceae bacterium]
MSKSVPKAKRFKMATIGVPDLDAVAPLYKEWLGYDTVARGDLAANLAASWGAPKSAGRPYVLMQPESGADVFIRAVEIDPVPSYKAMTTWGWNAIEIIVDDPDAVYDKLKSSPFTLLGKPEGLRNYPSIRATQFKGVAEDVLYLTAETGDRSNSLLPRPGAFIGRIFIMVVAGPNIQTLQDFYADTFDMERGTINNSPVDLINEAQGLPMGSERPLTTLKLAQHGNLFELDGYGDHTGPRPYTEGQLPPGIAITSITVENIDALQLETIAEPIPAYGGRTATIIGPAGELLELIEETS